MKSIFDRSFKYTPADQTNLKTTFRRIRHQLRQEAQARAAADAATKAKVSQLKKGTAQ